MQPLPHDERISAYLDDELPPAERRAFEAELEANAALQDAVDRFTRARDLMRRHGHTPAPSGFADRVLDAIDDAEAANPRDTWWRRPLGLRVEAWALAAVALLVLWFALPEPAAPPVEAGDAFADAPSGTVASDDGSLAVARVPTTWILQTDAPLDDVRTAVVGAGGQWDDGSQGIAIRVNASDVRGVEAVLGRMGNLRRAGAQAVRGAAEIKLSVSKP